MDLMRTTYRSSMRLYFDRPDILTAGEWHYCRPGAQPLGFLHSFGSQIWDPKGWDWDPPVGEVRGMAGRVTGDVVAGLDGRHHCGTPWEWRYGVRFVAGHGLEIGPDGIPTCCRPHKVEKLTLAWSLVEVQAPTSLELAWQLDDVEDVEVQGLTLAWQLRETPPPALNLAWDLADLQDVEVEPMALAWSLRDAQDVAVEVLRLAWRLEWTPPPVTVVIVCGGCTEGPAVWTLSVSGFAGDSAGLNGEWRIAYSGSGCAWDSLAGADPTMTNGWSITYTGLAGWVLRGRYDPLNVLADYVPAAAWSCTGPTNAMNFSSGNNVPSHPSTLTLTFP